MRNKPAPPAKWVIRDHLLAELYKPVDDLRQKEIGDIIERNTTLLQAQDMALHKKILPERFHRSFAYNGDFYTLDGESPHPVRNRLHPSLEDEMARHVAFYLTVTEERMRVSGFFDSMLAYSPSPGDWLQILPQSLHDPLRSIVVSDSWTELRTPGEIEAFTTKHRPRFDLIRQRMAINLIL